MNAVPFRPSVLDEMAPKTTLLGCEQTPVDYGTIGWLENSGSLNYLHLLVACELNLHTLMFQGGL